MLSRKDYIRYSRQIMLPAFGEHGQERLAQAHVAVIGLGGLGCPVLQYLVGAGIGRFTLVDDDYISLENLHRQLLYQESDINDLKVSAVEKYVARRNPAAQIKTYKERLRGESLEQVLDNVDIVLDCTDSIESRLEINFAAVKTRVAHIVGTGIRAEGQIVSFDHSQPNSPCLSCVMSEQDGSGLTCAESGVMGPVLGVIGSAMAMAAIKYLAIPGSLILNQWQFYDAMTERWMRLSIEPNTDCVSCS